MALLPVGVEEPAALLDSDEGPDDAPESDDEVDSDEAGAGVPEEVFVEELRLSVL